jgi:hypothetical protein
MKQCFHELLVLRRSGRRGFPEDALRELFALEQYYHESHKTDQAESGA